MEDYPTTSDTYEDTAFYADIPEERKEAEQEEKAIKAASYPIMGDIADWFEEQIKLTDSRAASNTYATLHGIPKDIANEAFDVLRDLLNAKYQEFKDFKHED